jgi:restriction system protein
MTSQWSGRLRAAHYGAAHRRARRGSPVDSSPLVEQVLRLWWGIPILVLLGVLQSPWFKGLLGESLVKVAAKLRLPSDIYRRMHNVTLPLADGTTQIDHVFVSRFGVFVIETKNMKGWIFGTERDAQWTQNIFGNTFKFQNPLRQNYRHLKALESILPVPVDTIHSIVVFPSQSVFKSAVPANVTCGIGYIKYIKAFKEPVLTDTQVSEVMERIQSARLAPSFATTRKHIKNLEDRHDQGVERTCPRCGNRMILRTAKQGSRAGKPFWGCAGYPRCKAVQSVA